MNDYEQYLADLHAKMVTPDEIISAAVKEGTHKGTTHKTRIVAGEANEVYDVELIGDNHIIIRISRADKLEFEQERWAIEKCREVGVPVPVVLLIKHIETEQGPLHICVQEKLEGVPLERGGLDFGTFPEERKKRIIFQAGEMLAKVQNDYQANAASGISS